LFEPNPQSFAELKENLAECGVSAIHLYNLALGDSTGEKEFLAARSMTKSVKDAPAAGEALVSTNMFSAECRPLQDFESFFTDQHIHILKIDVEGGEMDVLAGARGLLNGMQVDVLYIEVGMNRDGTQQTYLSRIDGFLQDYGYRAFKIYEQKHEWIEDSPLLRRCNIAYMSSRCAANNPYSVVRENYLLKKEVERLKAERNRNN
jgi:FkbM family methyltransferase